MRKRRQTNFHIGMLKIGFVLCMIFPLTLTGYSQNAPFQVVETGAGKFATLKGAVTFQGEVPAARRFQAAKDQDVCGSEEHLIEDVRLSEEGRLLDIVVEIKGVEGPREWPTLPEESFLNQEHCRFSPNVVVVPNERKLTIINSDPVLHNINSGFFNIAQPLKDQKNDQTIQVDQRRRGKFIRMNCNVHDWMEAWLYVPQSPYYVLAGKDGQFTIDQIPPGDYTVTIMHPFLGTQSYDVTFGKGEVVELTPVLLTGKKRF